MPSELQKELSWREVKEKWRGMVSGAKKEHSKCAIAGKKTGGRKKQDSPRATNFLCTG